MINFKIFLFIFLNFILVFAEISDLRKCANEDCTELISLAKTLINYKSDDNRILSFKTNVKVKIFSKEAGIRLDLWGAEINGKRGYVPVGFIRETKVLNNNLKYLKSTEEEKDNARVTPAPKITTEYSGANFVLETTPLPTKDPIQNTISPNAVTPPYEIIDGTTLYPLIKNSTQEYSSTPNSIDSFNTEAETVTSDPKSVLDNNISKENVENIEIEKEINEEKINVNRVELSTDKEVKVEDEKENAEDDEGNIEEDEVDEENVFDEGEENDSDDDDEEHAQVNEEQNVNKKDSDQTKTEVFSNIDDLENKKENNKITGNMQELNDTEFFTNNLSENPSSETVFNSVNHLNSFKSDNITEIQTESSLSTVAEQGNDNFHKEIGQEEPEMEEINESVKRVPSDFHNPLNLFHQASEKVRDDIKVDNSHIQTQVPEDSLHSTNTENQISANEFMPPIDSSADIFTENPNHISIDSVNDVEDITKKFEEPVTEVVNDKQIKYDNLDEPTFFDQVEDKYKPLEEISQKTDNSLEPSIENISDSVEDNPVQEELVSGQNLVSEDVEGNKEPGIFSKIYTLYASIFKSGAEESKEEITKDKENLQKNEISNEVSKSSEVEESKWEQHFHENPVEKYLLLQSDSNIQNYYSVMQSCASGEKSTLCETENKDYIKNENEFLWAFEIPENTYNIFLYLSLTAVTVLLFSLGHYYIEKKRKDGTLVASINTLEKKLLISSKECLLLQDELKITKERLISIEDSSFGSNEMVTSLKEELEDSKLTRIELEEQVTNLEKELENATEAGMELNRMLRDILTSQSGNQHLMQNVEQLQKQLNEQQETINAMKASLNTKNMENELLQTELSVANEKNTHLQDQLNQITINLLTVEEEKNNIEKKLEEQNVKLKSQHEITVKQINNELKLLKEDSNKLKKTIEITERSLDLKNNEYDLLKQGMTEMQAAQNNKESLMALLDVSQVKAEVQQLRDEKHKIVEKLEKKIEEKLVLEKEVQIMIQEVKILKDKFEEAEKEKVEAQTRLEVLSSYFKDKEAQLQKEINENESKFVQKEGEATSTVERIKWIQEELQNYKAQNELLKKEILDQEVSLKSQISMLEKKSHDNWVLARQAERRLEESKQEASQLRNRLTIVEKNINNTSHMTDESKMPNRIMSPLESNGELPVSPLHMTHGDNPGSPPLLYPHRDHMTTSPPLPPFMPPPGVPPFMPPPLPGMPPFMPPPPALFPGDHRPPPLGRMSSPPLHGRYSPDSRAYSPYDRDDSPPLSPNYPDSDYRRRSPPPPTSHIPPRSYVPHWDRDADRDYRGKQQRNKPRTHKGLSSGSGNSNESLDNSGRHSGRV